MPRLTDILLSGQRNHADIRKKMFGSTQTFAHRAVVRPNVLGNRVSEANKRSSQGNSSHIAL